MQDTTLDYAGPTKRKARQLAPAMLAKIRESPPISSYEALRALQCEGRVSFGVSASVAGLACSQLKREGLIEEVRGGFRPIVL